MFSKLSNPIATQKLLVVPRSLSLASPLFVFRRSGWCFTIWSVDARGGLLKYMVYKVVPIMQSKETFFKDTMINVVYKYKTEQNFIYLETDLAQKHMWPQIQKALKELKEPLFQNSDSFKAFWNCRQTCFCAKHITTRVSYAARLSQ